MVAANGIECNAGANLNDDDKEESDEDEDDDATFVDAKESFPQDPESCYTNRSTFYSYFLLNAYVIL